CKKCIFCFFQFCFYNSSFFVLFPDGASSSQGSTSPSSLRYSRSSGIPSCFLESTKKIFLQPASRSQDADLSTWASGSLILVTIPITSRLAIQVQHGGNRQ